MQNSKARSSLAVWYARMCGTLQVSAKSPVAQSSLVKPNPQVVPQAVVAREVQIDTETRVPYELYKDLVSAGRRAKSRGQHQLKSQSWEDSSGTSELSIPSSSSGQYYHLVLAAS
ncbi:unnamed protein product [Polarella glacialis]|uniref:Uncharacterized protein n=1 Tax=Polarella glacialis TaxID=89957 RepID=A0A813LPI1_POLGL|nr:unnamed protein product [Polarella glacialis]CAE8635554.1 unnamed protein product [Polarella glacialis]CAE8649042.1 unnamed protein product [Polarella glacialis]CAE8734880.1 unnamed protein product [Polarella glacialis]